MAVLAMAPSENGGERAALGDRHSCPIFIKKCSGGKVRYTVLKSSTAALGFPVGGSVELGCRCSHLR